MGYFANFIAYNANIKQKSAAEVQVHTVRLKAFNRQRFKRYRKSIKDTDDIYSNIALYDFIKIPIFTSIL